MYCNLLYRGEYKMESFQLLRIRPTKDINVIRKAYSSLFKEYSRKKNPEAFKLFRESYRKALLYSKGIENDIKLDENVNESSSLLKIEFNKALLYLEEGFAIKGINSLKSIYKIKPNYPHVIEYLMKASLILNDPFSALKYSEELNNSLLYNDLLYNSAIIYIDTFTKKNLMNLDKITIYFLAKSYFLKGEFDESNLILEKYYKEYIDNIDTLTLYIYNLLKLNKVRKAYELCNKGINIYKDSYKFYLIKGDILSSLNKYSEAFVLYEEAIEKNNKVADIYCSKSNVLNMLGRFEEGIKASNMAIRYNKLLETSYKYKMLSLIELGRYEECLAVCKEVLAFNLRVADIYEIQMQLYILLDSPTESLSIFKTALENSVQSSNLYYEKGRALLILDMLLEAEDACLAAIALNAEKIESYNLLAKIYFLQKNYEKANKYFDKVIEKDVFSRDAYLYKSKCLDMLKRKKEALIIIDDAINLHLTGLEEFYYNKGVYLYETGNILGAINTLRDSIECNNYYKESYLLLGLIYSRQKNYEESERYLEYGTVLDKSNIEIILELSNVYIKLKKFDNCIRCCNEGLKLKIDKEEQILLNLYKGRALLEKGDDFEAEVAANTLINLSPINYDILKFRLDVFKYKEDYEECLKIYNTIIKLGGYLDEALLHEIEVGKRRSKRKSKRNR